jgi:chromosomal replication initiator protein
LTTSESEVVAALGQAIARRVGEPRYQLWFSANTKFRCEEGLLIVGVPNHFFQEWLEKTFAEDVRAAAGDVLGMPVQARFVIDPELFQAARRAQAHQATLSPPNAEDAPSLAASRPLTKSEPAAKPPSFSPRQRRWRRLRDFVVGPCNRLAHAAALAVVESPGEEANPLVIYGPVGTGKTHLLEGIYQELRKARPDQRVCFTTCEEFTNRFVQAMRSAKLAPFRHQFRECNALLIDDLQFLAGKRATQEEFLHTFDAILAKGGQVVATCDCHPKLTEDFGPELCDRLMGGPAWALVPPDDSTRLQLLRVKVARAGVPISDQVLQMLAAGLKGNVRELEGALHSVAHAARVSGKEVDTALAREVLGELLRHSIRAVHLKEVEEAVCRALRLESQSLRSSKRAWAVSHPRMIAMYLARKHTTATYSEIGHHFGGRNHSTAVAAEKKVRQWLTEAGEVLLGNKRWNVHDAVGLAERELLS